LKKFYENLSEAEKATLGLNLKPNDFEKGLS
jgi:hypothetical protein